MIKKIIFLSVVAFLMIESLTGSAQPEKQHSNLTLWDNEPSKSWMTESYPLGNGRMGGMVFGGVTKEHIQFNEQSLWTGDEEETGAYQAFGDLYINFSETTEGHETSNYRRQLDIQNAIQQINYNEGGTTYQRNYFCSFPDNVMVLNYTANKKKAYSAVIKLEDAHGAIPSANGISLQVTGKLNNGLKYQAKLTLLTTGGALAMEPDGKGGHQLHLKNADAFTVLLSATTDYVPEREKGWRGEDPEIKNNRILTFASKKGYKRLLKSHLEDYRELFGRVSLSLGDVDSLTNLPTRERLTNYKKSGDNGLEALLFQYGRYLLISSSRKGGLPANLQGIWNESNDPPWRSDYHSNINVQMNYWPGEPTNLSECNIPYLDYINNLREVKKENTAKEYPGVRGWTVKTENNIFGGSSFIWNTPGSAWYMQGVWDHYAFTQDKEYLRNFAYPIIKEVVEFWDDHLKRRPDGTLVSPMGWSPEHGPTEDGVTFDQELVYDLFANYIDASDILSVDGAYRNHVADMRSHLLMPKIGKWGQLQEWETDRDDPNDHHRHSSNLFGLYPGKRISWMKTPKLAEAAKISLNARGDESTGWSMAWKMNFWARLHDGEHAYKILNNFITLVEGAGVDYDKGGGVYSNLLCAHPPFQIDGNLGFSAGIAEMLVQSQTGFIQLLPALPGKWKSGEVKGLCTRQAFEIDNLTWKDGKVMNLCVKSMKGEECTILSPNRLICSKDINAIVDESHSSYMYKFKTKSGTVYKFNMAK